MPTTASIRRDRIVADLNFRQEAGEDVTTECGGAPHIKDGSNVVFVNHGTRFVCIQCYELFKDDDATYGFGGMTQHCATKCQAKDFVTANPNLPHVYNATDQGGGTEGEETDRRLTEVILNPVVKAAWSQYCTDTLFLPGGGLHTKAKLEEFMGSTKAPFFFNSQKRNKDDYKLLVRNTPPQFDPEHPFWTTLEDS